MVGYSNIINKKSSTTITKDSFVAPSPSCNHSMLHQNFYPPLFRFPKSPNPFSATASLLPPPPPPLPEVERNPSSMEAGAAAAAALQETRLPAAAPPVPEELEPEFVFPDDVDWAVEHANILDEFLVDDLLDFDEAEVEETKQENTFEANTPTAAAAATTTEIFEPAPLSDMDLNMNLPRHNPEEFEWMSSIIDESMVEYPPSAALPKFIPATHKWLPAVKRAKRSEGLRIPCSSWPCPFTKSDSSGSSTTTVSTTSSSSSSQYNTHSLFKYGSSGNYQFDQKKRGRKPKNHQLPRAAYPAAAGRAGGGSSNGERSCTHCGSQKTPQWRLGPMGPKTLCNACGVRYKSGRLVPEYRPAASPTFIPQVHSSSHRKVMEMRRKKEMEAAAPPRAASC